MRSIRLPMSIMIARNRGEICPPPPHLAAFYSTLALIEIDKLSIFIHCKRHLRQLKMTLRSTEKTLILELLAIKKDVTPEFVVEYLDYRNKTRYSVKEVTSILIELKETGMVQFKNKNWCLV